MFFTQRGISQFNLDFVQAELSDDKTQVVFFDDVQMEEAITYPVETFKKNLLADADLFLMDFRDGHVAGGLQMASPLQQLLPTNALFIDNPGYWTFDDEEKEVPIHETEFGFIVSLDEYLEDIEQEVCLLKSNRGRVEDFEYLQMLIPEELRGDLMRVEEDEMA